ncbi:MULTISPECIES: hypothetical protein [unclassified Streptomyces]|uniref:hypothetical protein n=1 Tax=unclassified Streptomyces TaxID=2593676 RepID=UPI0036EC3205
MPSVEDHLHALLDEPGVAGAVLADAVTGLTYGEAGNHPADGEGCSRIAVLAEDRLHAAGGRGALESIVVTSARRTVVLRLLPGPTDPLLLTVTLEREQANLALVMRRLERYGDEAAG